MPCCDRNSHPSSGQIWAAEFDRSHFPQPKDGLHAQPTNLTRIAIAALALGASLVAGADPFDTPRINVFVSLPVDGGHRQAPTLGLNLQRNGLASSPLDLSANRFTFFDLRYQARNDSLKLNGLELNRRLQANATGGEVAAGINWTYVAIGAAAVVGGVVVYNNAIKDDKPAPAPSGGAGGM